MTRSTVQRGVSLTGAQGSDWLRSRGWLVRTGRANVFADVMDATKFGYSRTWLGPGQYRKEAVRPAESPSRVSALLLVEGSANLEIEQQTSEFTVGDVVLIGGASTLSLSADAPVALYEIVTDYDRMGLERYALPPTSGPYASSRDYWPALTGVINQVLGSGVNPNDFGMGSIRTAVDSLLLASLKESTAMTARKRTEQDSDLVQRARTIIQNEAHSPDLTVARLADLVRVSRAHLHRIFAAESSTPLAEIREARVDIARLHLAEKEGLRESDLQDIAQKSGFRTAAALRRALRRS